MEPLGILAAAFVILNAIASSDSVEFVLRALGGITVTFCFILFGVYIHESKTPQVKLYTVHGVEYAHVNNVVYVRNNSLELELVGVVVKEK